LSVYFNNIGLFGTSSTVTMTGRPGPTADPFPLHKFSLTVLFPGGLPSQPHASRAVCYAKAGVTRHLELGVSINDY